MPPSTQIVLEEVHWCGVLKETQVLIAGRWVWKAGSGLTVQLLCQSTPRACGIHLWCCQAMLGIAGTALPPSMLD